jgi:hypothetical protein
MRAKKPRFQKSSGPLTMARHAPKALVVDLLPEMDGAVPGGAAV